jgi:two-component system CheB/CheR fusion protein
LQKLLETILPYNLSVENYEMEALFPSIGRKKVVLNARRLNSKVPGSQLILLAIELSKPL